LYYYQEALNLYLNKHGDTAGPAKIAVMEKSIALALHNKGRYVESLEHFERALEHYGVSIVKRPIGAILMFLVGFLDFLVSLYWPFLKYRKSPTQKDKEILYLMSKMGECLTQVNPRRMFIEAFHHVRRFNIFNPIELEYGAENIIGFSLMFTWPGISFRLSRKVLTFAKGKVDSNDATSVFFYETTEFVHNYWGGSWDAVREYADDLVNWNLSAGEFFAVLSYVFWYSHLFIDQGNFIDGQRMQDKLLALADEYEHYYQKNRDEVSEIFDYGPDEDKTKLDLIRSIRE